LSAPRRILTLGDALVDVVAETGGAPVPDDDVTATITLTPGGQAANVAAWASHLGADAAMVTALGDDPAGHLVRELLGARQVTVRAATAPARTGTVVSLVSGGGHRTMLSDRGAAGGLRAEHLRPAWFAGLAWLHISGYALFSSEEPDAALTAAALAAGAGASVSVDLSAATLVAHRGGSRCRALLQTVRPELVFGTADEFEALGPDPTTTRVVKLGADGYRLEAADGTVEEFTPDGTAVVRDTTGAGDAFAAGWLVGGPALAVKAAEQCIAAVGAMPPAV
jgi:sugar/nucleoside kinase (ribokinase family)